MLLCRMPSRYREPSVPTRSRIRSHNITNMPYQARSKHCVAAKRRNSPRLCATDPSQRSKLLLVADYCCVGDNQDKELATILVARLYPAKVLLATACPYKGGDDQVVARMASFIKDSCYRSIVDRGDQEPSIRAMFEEAVKVSTRSQDVKEPCPMQISITWLLRRQRLFFQQASSHETEDSA